MLLLSCADVRYGYDATPLFEGVTFEVHTGDHVGFVGPNGAGKSTLIKVITGQLEPDHGEVKLHPGVRLGILAQTAEFAPGRTVFEEAKSGFDELLATQNELVAVADLLSNLPADADPNERRLLSEKFDSLNESLASQDAYQLDHKIEDVLDGLNFRRADHHREIRTLSGGQQRRLLLAKLLISSPDLMLLDEPSNHLDIATTRWLEDYLARQNQAMMVVSHDRYFLDKVSRKIVELHNKRVTVYPGNYKQYVRLRDEKYERELKEYTAQQEYITKQEDYIRRSNYGQLAKQAQSRVKALDKLEVREKPTKVAGPAMRFDEVSRSGDLVFRVDRLGKRFGEKVLFDDLSFDVPRGRRVGLMGPNGCGKTTLLRILLGEELPTSGEVQRGHLVFPGYLDQHLQLLDEEAQTIRAVWPEPDPALTEQMMRELLSKFGLHGELVYAPVRQLSGGERSRAALAKLTISGANVLILDEPTNHLDLWACESLEEAIRNFEGTVMVVSHDRYFLNRVCDLLIVIEPGRTEVVHGNYDTFELLRNARAEAAKHEKPKPAPKPAPAQVVAPPAVGPDGAPLGKVKRKRQFAYRKPHELEADIAKAEAKLAQLEEALTRPEVYRDPAQLHDTLDAVEEIKAKLPALYAHWEEAVELNN